MAAYIIINRSKCDLHIVIPSPGRNDMHITLLEGRSINILPFAGTKEACRRISQIRDYSERLLLEIIEE